MDVYNRGVSAALAVSFDQIGGYELLKRTAKRVDDSQTVQLCSELLSEKRSMSELLADSFDRAVAATLA